MFVRFLAIFTFSVILMVDKSPKLFGGRKRGYLVGEAS
jgi:hypothetical protein